MDLASSITINEPSYKDRDDLMSLLTDPNVRRYLGGMLSKEAAVKRAASIITNSPDCYRVVRVYGLFAGLVSLTDHIEETGTELSYQFLPAFRGKGIASCAIKCILETVPRPVVAETQARNLKSVRLLQRLGFTEKRRVIRFGAEQIVFVLDG